MFLATAVAYACYRARLGGCAVGWADLGVLVLEAVFLVTSRTRCGSTTPGPTSSSPTDAWPCPD